MLESVFLRPRTTEVAFLYDDPGRAEFLDPRLLHTDSLLPSRLAMLNIARFLDSACLLGLEGGYVGRSKSQGERFGVLTSLSNVGNGMEIDQKLRRDGRKKHWLCTSQLR
jgi:hypothetical protein